MKLNIENKNTIDPIGLELVIAILSLSVTTLAALNQFGVLPSKAPKSTHEFKRLRNAILQAQNQLDNLVLTFQTYVSYSDNNGLQDNSVMTITSTLMYLHKNDYRRWNFIRTAISDVAHEVASVVRELHILESELDESVDALDDQYLLSVFDDLFLKLSSVTLSEFVKRLRDALDVLSKSLAHVAETHQERRS